MTELLHVVVIGDLDPLTVEADAAAQVIEGQLHRRVANGDITLEFCTTAVAADPRARTRWAPAANGDWADRADQILDVRPAAAPPPMPTTAPVLAVDLSAASSLFPEQVDAAALDARRTMLSHLGIDATTTEHALTATDLLALGAFTITALGDDERLRLMAEFDRAGEAILARIGNGAGRAEPLQLEISRLRRELIDLRAAHAKFEAEAAEQLETAARRTAELMARLEATALIAQRR